MSGAAAARTLMVTGAAGFLGRAVVAEARRRGHGVVAVLRPGRAAALPEGWAEDPGLRAVFADLAAPGAAETLGAALEGVAAVIHAAAALRGDDAAQRRDTLAPTEALVAALAARAGAPDGAPGGAPRLVLVSSFAVYGYAALPAGATLDERTPVEPEPERRDAYCRAKLAQERLVIAAAQEAGLQARILRPGALYGPGREGSARLGLRRGGRILCIGGQVPVPAVHVESAAAALVRAAELPPGPSDIPLPAGGPGGVEIVNLVDPDPPTQADWLAALAAARPGAAPRVLRLPARPFAALARGLALALDLAPPRLSGALARRLPAVLLEPGFAALFKPLRYSTARQEDRLGHRPAQGFRLGPAAAAETPRREAAR